MQFASFTLIFLFLPITMLLFYLTPNRWKREVMLGISLLFLCSGGWLAAAVEILLTALTYGAGLLLEHLRQRKHLSRLVLTGSILLHFGALLLLRSDWLFSLKAGWFSGKSLFPLGLAFFTLQSVGYCIDVFRGKIHGEKNWQALGLYLLFYPRLIMGPVVSYSVAVKSLCTPVFDIARVGQGLLRFLVGLGKKLILANWLGMLFQTLCQADTGTYSLMLVWLGAFAQLMTLYLELSGYADMAIGLGLCYGVRLPESFGKSLFYPSMAAFADQWNRTVVQWFSHYVGTHFRGKNHFLYLFCHAGNMGLYRSLVWLPAAVAAVRTADRRGTLAGASSLEKLVHSVIRYILTAVLLSLGAVLLSLPDLQSVWSYVRIMVGTGSLAPTEADADVLRAYGLIFLACSLQRVRKLAIPAAAGRGTVLVPPAANTADAACCVAASGSKHRLSDTDRRCSVHAAVALREVHALENQTSPPLEKTDCGGAGRHCTAIFRQTLWAVLLLGGIGGWFPSGMSPQTSSRNTSASFLEKADARLTAALPDAGTVSENVEQRCCCHRRQSYRGRVPDK